MDMAKPDMTKMRRADRDFREDALAVIDRCAYGTLSPYCDGRHAVCGGTERGA